MLVGRGRGWVLSERAEFLPPCRGALGAPCDPALTPGPGRFNTKQKCCCHTHSEAVRQVRELERTLAEERRARLTAETTLRFLRGVHGSGSKVVDNPLGPSLASHGGARVPLFPPFTLYPFHSLLLYSAAFGR